MNSIALLILQGVLSSLGLFVMKIYLGNAKASIVAGDFLDRAVMMACGGFSLYVVSFGLWMLILVKTPLSYAYPISIGITLLVTSFLAVLFLSEVIGLARGIGMLAILIGVVIIHTSR